MFTRRPYGHCPIRVWGLLVAIALNHPVRAQMLPPGGYSLTAISLVGSEYNAISSNADSTLLALSDLGYGTGTTPRFTSGGSGLGEDAFAFAGTGPSPVANLTGPGYEFASGGGIFRRGRPVAMNGVGQVVGTSYRFNAGGTYQGRDVWIQSGSASAELIGLVGPDYQPGTTRYSEVLAINESGFVIGQSLRGGGTSIPSDIDVPLDAWLFDGTTTTMINPTGSVYEAVSPTTGFKRTGAPVALNALGQVIGQSRRYGPQGQNLGYDAWRYTGSGPAEIVSMTGPEFEYAALGGTFRRSLPASINSSGAVAGTAERYSSGGTDLGRDVWLFNATGPARVISLTGAGYDYALAGSIARTSGLVYLADSDRAVGYVDRFSSNGSGRGRDTWYYDGASATAVINLTGSNYEYTGSGGINGRYGEAEFINGSAKVIGYSNRYTPNNLSLGRDAWFYGGSGVTQIVSLTGPNYEEIRPEGVYRYGDAAAINAAGQGIGTSSILGTNAGQDVWFFDGISTSRAVSLTGPRYEFVFGAKTGRSAALVALNDNGQAAGYNLQYDSGGNSIGRSGWFFDAATGVTSPLDFSFASDGSSDSRPSLLTDAGVVLGTYSLFDGATSESRLFWWSTEAGFHDFTDLIPSGIEGAGWDNLSSLMGLDIPGAAGITSTGSPEYIAGRGKMTGQTSAARTFFLLSVQVPEPIFPLFAIVLLTALKRRPAAQNAEA